MFLRFAMLALALTASLHLSWLLVYQWRRARPVARSPEPGDQPPAPDPTILDGLVVHDAAHLALPISHAIAWPRDWRALLRTSRCWLHSYREEALAALAALGAVVYLAWFFPRTAGITQPGQFGHPFQGFHWVGDFLTEHAQWLPLALALPITAAGLGLLGRAMATQHNREQTTRTALAGVLVAALGTAGLGQLILSGFVAGPGLLLYVAAIGLFAFWTVMYQPKLAADLFESSWPRWLEALLLSLTIGLTIFIRFYSLRTIQYGFEGDEAKWTVEVINAMVDGVFPGGTEFHISTMPLSFFMQAPFHWLLGPSMLSARIAVASYSVLGSLVFYWLARSLTCAPVAWLATTLLAVSLLDVSASRLANVESHVKLAPLLALALLVRATRTGRPATYAMCGAAVALGMLTYDTVLPLVGICLVLLLYELVRARVPLAESVRRVSAFLAPIAIVLPMTIAYVAGRFDYYSLYASGTRPSEHGRLGQLLQNTGEVVHTLFVAVAGDFLYNRQGPLFNGLLLPWLALGMVLALISWRQGRLLWVLVWAGLVFFGAPVLTHSPFGRTYYPALPAAYLLMALALYAAYRELGRALGPAFKPALRGLAVVGLALLALSNLYIYFNLVFDPSDRQMRRELYDISQTASGPNAMVYYPYLPQAGDPIEFEEPSMIWLGTRRPDTTTGERYPHALVPLDALLPSLAALNRSYERAELVWFTAADDRTRPLRDAVLDELLRCYPAATRVPGQFYDRYVIPAAALHAPACTR